MTTRLCITDVFVPSPPKFKLRLHHSSQYTAIEIVFNMIMVHKKDVYLWCMCVLFFKALITLQNMSISNDIDGSPISYNITYSDFTSARMCSTFSIPAATCWDGVCQHMSWIASSCSPNDDIAVSVLSINILGSGPPSQPVIFSLIVNNDHSESLCIHYVHQTPLWGYPCME